MKKLIFLLLTAFIFQANAQDKILKKMGANKKFYISQEEIIDLEKSFTVQNIVLDSDPIYYSSNLLFDSINEFLKKNSTVIDMVYENGKPVYVSDYLVVVGVFGFKIYRAGEEVLYVFIDSFKSNSWRKRMKDYVVINAVSDRILTNSSERIIKIY